MDLIQEAGGIVFRPTGGCPYVLLVRAKKQRDKWIFPKGHCAPGESSDATALREVSEEAGVEGVLVGPVGAPLEFLSGEEAVRVQYYLIRATKEGASPEGREKQWLTLEDALRTASFEDARELLRAASPEITARAQANEPNRLGELLLQEHGHVADSLLRNEEDGEKRVTFFITLAGSVGAVLAYLAGNNGAAKPANRDPLIIFPLLVLCALGHLTLARVVRRNVASDRYKRGLARIRRYFLEGPEDPRVRFLPFHPYRLEFRRLWSWRRLPRGGWLEIIAAMEALVFGALVAVLAARGSWWTNGLVGIAGLAIAWPLLLEHANRRYRKMMWEARDGVVLERETLLYGWFGSSRMAAARRIRGLGFEAKEVDLKPCHENKPHSHPSDQILFLLNGDITLEDIRQEELVSAQPGDSLFIPRSLPYRLQTENGARCLLGVASEASEKVLTQF